MIMLGLSDRTIDNKNGTSKNNIKSTNKYSACSCCPYGYHIDLDFVRYCESLGQPNQNAGVNKRRERRRQRQSMEVMLGLIAPAVVTTESPEQKRELDSITEKKWYCPNASDMVKEALKDVVSDFEKTFNDSAKLELKYESKPKYIKNIGNARSAYAFNVVDLDMANENLSKTTLHSIREQMAFSLERMRDLEEKIKIIPQLQNQLLNLKEEKNQLLKQLSNCEQKASALKLNSLSKSSTVAKANSLPRHNHSRSMSNLFNHNTRDVAVACRVITRDIGVGHAVSKSRSIDDSPRRSPKELKNVACATHMSMCDIETLYEQLRTELSNKARLNERAKSMKTESTETNVTMDDIEQIIDSQVRVKLSDITNNIDAVSTGTQCEMRTHKADVGVQFDTTKTTSNAGVQTIERKPKLIDSGVNAKPKVHDASVAVDTVERCKVCDVAKCTVGVGTDFKIPAPVSLHSLMVPRSKSFNVGDDFTRKIKSTSTQCNVPASNVSVQTAAQSVQNKTCQYEHPSHAFVSRSCQCEIKRPSIGRSTDTFGLITYNDRGVNSSKVNSFDVACSVDRSCKNCENRNEDATGAAPPSRIPRPANITTPPPENRRFKRQQTYTKIPASPGLDPTTMQLSALEGVTTSTTSILTDALTNTTKKSENAPCVFKDSVSLQSASKHSERTSVDRNQSDQHANVVRSRNEISQRVTIGRDAISTTHFASQNTSIEDNSLFLPIDDKQRQKVQPSKEMRAAMKVLNDCLQKSPNSNVAHQLKNATNIIQQEWFKISSVATADPLDVEDYLDCFEEISSALLQYVVNMADMSGNTAMHYAVSHGNFDVVSILLDSKVCNINRPNKAGYTSVMLVSLTEMRSPTHANVVKRLFQLADVNVRAKQHGQTALMLAVSHGRLDMVTMLLEAGADVNIQDEDGSTALMCAAEHGHVDIVRHFLSQHDCDSSIIDVDGSTALKIALEAGHRDIGVLLYAHERMSHGSSPYSSLKHRRSKGSTPTSTPPLNSPSRTHPDVAN